MNYRSPGNVRELFNTVESTLAMARHEPVLFQKHLPTELRISLARQNMKKRAVEKPDKVDLASECLSSFEEFRKSSYEKHEKEYLDTLMTGSKGDIKQACEVSGLSRSRLYALLQKHGTRKPCEAENPYFSRLQSYLSGRRAVSSKPLNNCPLLNY